VSVGQLQLPAYFLTHSAAGNSCSSCISSSSCCCCCSVVDDRSLYDNDVFNSTVTSPSFHSEVRLRRATVGGELTTRLQSCLSTGDIPSLCDQQATRKSRPKTLFFQWPGNDLLDWNQLLKSDSTELLEHAPKTGSYNIFCLFVSLQTALFHEKLLSFRLYQI